MHLFILFISLLSGIDAAKPYNFHRATSRIVGGKDASIKDYPYQVSIQWDGEHWCGGSIISKNHVLTAAHCFRYISIDELTVRAGSSLHDSGGSIHTVVSNLTYPDAKADVALLKVVEPFVYDTTRQPMKLFDDNENASPGTIANVTGWGRLHESATIIPRQLQVVSVPMVSRESCAKAFDGTSLAPIVEGQVCAGYLGQGGKDACQADSGGPLVIDGKQVGVVSSGRGCARPNYPGIYGNVAYVRKWIKDNSGV